MKKCKICGLPKLLDEFATDNRVSSKKGALCKICKKLRNKKYKLNRNDKLKSERSNYYQKNKKRLLLLNKTYMKNNKDKVKERRRNYYIENKDRRNAQNKIRQATFKGRFVAWKYNAKKRNIDWDLTIEDLQTIPMVCHYTGEILTLEKNKINTISLDRIDNAKGYTVNNVVFCCCIINEMKMNRSVKDFVEWCSKVCSTMLGINSCFGPSIPAKPVCLHPASSP
jgi:hypothetical protein